MFTKEQYLEMILDELEFSSIKVSNNFIAYLSAAKKDRLVKFYEILCNETETPSWVKEQQIIKVRYC